MSLEELFETVRFAGDVRDWRDTPESEFEDGDDNEETEKTLVFSEDGLAYWQADGPHGLEFEKAWVEDEHPRNEAGRFARVPTELKSYNVSEAWNETLADPEAAREVAAS